MHRASTALLIFLMLTFLLLGLYGLGQHMNSHIFSGAPRADQVR